MNELQIFSNPDFGDVRAVTINGEPWFVGKDVADMLGYSDTFGALKKHVDIPLLIFMLFELNDLISGDLYGNTERVRTDNNSHEPNPFNKPI